MPDYDLGSSATIFVVFNTYDGYALIMCPNRFSRFPVAKPSVRGYDQYDRNPVQEPAMSPRREVALNYFIKILSGLFFIMVMLLVIHVSMTASPPREELFWGIFLLVLFVVTLVISLSTVNIMVARSTSTGDLEHLLKVKSIWQHQYDAHARVSLGKFIRVGRPKQQSPDSGTTLDRLVTIKKQGHWLPDDQ